MSDQKKLRQERKEAGQCIQCGKVDGLTLSGHSRCADCLVKNNKARSILRDRRRVAGLCIYCGKKPAMEGADGCMECMEKNAKRVEKFRNKKRQNGRNVQYYCRYDYEPCIKR